MKYINNDTNRIKIESDDISNYFYCLNCGKRVYEDDVEKTDKYWDDDGNHYMIYVCPYCNYENYE